MSTEHEAKLLTTSEAAQLLRVSVKCLQGMVRRGLLPVRRFGSKGRVWRFLASDLLAPIPTESSVTWDQRHPSRLWSTPAPSSGRRLEKVKGGLRYR